ncbi:MAG: Na+/galactose cotransporter, partial [Rubrobacter sp.]|nr:Na+/galactose cotransporter [Rubrobacter sp.]
MTGLGLLQLKVSVDESWVDYLIIGIYFVFVLGIGALLRNKMQTSEDYFLSGRSLPSWVTGLAFLGANLGALEILGMGAGAAQYGLMQAHFYWIGAIPAMVFVALFMIPFYYGSRVHSVPGYLKLRYNEATRGFNAV